MKKLLLGGLLALVCVFAALADVLALKPDHPDTYVVKKGDTLWDISNVFLKSPWLWPQLWHNNPQVKDPHLIYPGDVLNLVYIDGKPQLVLKRGAGGDVKLEPEVRVVADRSARSPRFRSKRSMLSESRPRRAARCARRRAVCADGQGRPYRYRRRR